MEERRPAIADRETPTASPRPARRRR